MSIETSSPVDSSGGTSRWTTTNAAEGMPGVITPLTWSFYFPAIERATRRTWRDLGALRADAVAESLDPDRCFYGIFAGRMAMNLDRFCSMADLMPGSSAAKLEEHLFGGSTGAHTGVASACRYPIVAIKAPVGIARARRTVLTRQRQVGQWRNAVLLDIASGVDDSAARAHFRQAQRHFETIIQAHALISMIAQTLYDRVGRLAADFGCQDLVGSLVKTVAGTDETRTVSDLWELAHGRITEDQFVVRHGYHGPNEGHLSGTVWREDLPAVRRLVDIYRALPESLNPDETTAARITAQRAAEATLADRLGPVRARVLGPLLKLAAHFTWLREVGRSTLLQSVDGARAAARNLGAGMCERGLLDEPEAVFLLTVDELLHPAGAGFQQVVEQRHRDQNLFSVSELPQHWNGTPVPTRATVEAPVEQPTTVVGLAASPGTVEGIARTMSDSDDDLEPGEILVCHTTDPSWAPVFVVAAAVVIDIGGAMSHGAIVARDLNIPCVINTKNGISHIRTGDRIRVNGTTGTVDILVGGAQSPIEPELLETDRTRERR